MDKLRIAVQRALNTPICCVLATVYLIGASFALLWGELGTMAFFSSLVAANLLVIAATANRRQGSRSMRVNKAIELY